MVSRDRTTHRFSTPTNACNPLKHRIKRNTIHLSEIDGCASLFALLHAKDEFSTPFLGFSQRSHPSGLSNISLNQITHDVKVVYLPLRLNSLMQHINSVYQLNDKRLLLIIENFVTGCTEVYLETINNLNTALLERMPVATVNKLCQLSALDTLHGTLALYSVIEGELHTFQVDSLEGELYESNSHILLKPFSKKRQLPRIRQLLFILGTRELCFVENEAKVMIFDMKRKRFK
ncbi:hypothetical protein K7432_000309 [Basidiobolus ranarum]|uniref:Uncharacterized protein n=1 Tax=Basidiobolus ranarum TaxID=34480 RepID=A0ABR2X5B0_9FUNG